MSFIGPVLPPSNTDEKEDSSDEEGYIGPQLPIKKHKRDTTSQDDHYGPALPPDLAKQDEVIGPPMFQPEQNDVDDDAIVGPMPPANRDESLEKELRRSEIESRSMSMKEKLNPQAKATTQPVREEWMLKLPPEINPAVGLSMTSRKFRTKYIDSGDRSVWTDTPEEKAKKSQEAQQKKQTVLDLEKEMESEKDKQLKEAIDQYNKQHRGESLVDMHHRKRKAQLKDDEPGSNIRRPFNRETDLQLPQNIITTTKRKTLIKDSSKSLDSKFSHGREHFL